MKNKTITSNPAQVRKVLESVGSRIGSVDFRRRKDGCLRKMTYRLGVTNPSCASTPNGNAHRKSVDERNSQITVLSVNDVVRDKKGAPIGRGQWRTIPLETVERICADGVNYKVGHRR